MKKIILILSICILTGCSGSQIESCADDKYKSYANSADLSMSYGACERLVPGGKITNKMFFDEINGRIKFSNEFYKCALTERKDAAIRFINQSLRTKVSNQLYENYYLRCKTIYE